MTVALGIKITLYGLLAIAGNALLEKVTGSDIVDYVTEILPQLKDLILSIFEVFELFFDILPSHIGAVFYCFSSIMLIFIIYKLVKGGS